MEVQTQQLASHVSQINVPEEIKHNEGDMEKNFESSASIVGSTSGSLNSDNVNASDPEVSCLDNDNIVDDALDDDCDASDYDYDDDYDDDFMFDNQEEDFYLRMQEQFDNVELPAGVEASVPLLQHSASSSKTSAPCVPSQFGSSSDTEGATKLAIPGSSKSEAVASSSSSTAESNCGQKENVGNGDENMRKYESFKRFDVVDNYTDHHFIDKGFKEQQPPKEWMKKIQDEWKILEKGLPDTIYVRVYESRMELLRAVIIGPPGTPYHDGLFVFDVLFPPTYPNVPPMVYYYSGGLRLNPNLYDCGKVCLSLLNTWTGHGNEKWMPKSSTMLQVLVSIQALILNARPFFNEPGYEKTYVGDEGEKKSNAYNEEVFILSLKTMIYTLRRPPKHFEDFVANHFRQCAHDILSACKAYLGGASVGTVVKGKVESGNPVKKGSAQFQKSVKTMMKVLISSFSKYCGQDCEQFRPSY